MTCECHVRDGRLEIRGELTIYTAPEAKEQILKELKRRRRKPTVDLSGVDEIDTAGVQVLLLARRLCEAAGGRFDVANPSLAAREALSLCGLQQWFTDASNPESGS